MDEHEALEIAIQILGEYEPYEGSELDEPDIAKHMDDVEKAYWKLNEILGGLK